MTGTLYLVPTPIGNLGDLTDRARGDPAAADFTAAEDTRVSLRLLNHLGLKKPLVSYHQHNRAESGPRILRRLQAGETCALVTEAGKPAISDPGEDLVALCAEAGVPVCALAGPCAAVTALAVSGLSTGRFAFEGFLPAAGRERRERLAALAAEPRTMVFYEAPHRLLRTLEDLAAAFGEDRPAALCRELTKLHEEVLRLPLGQALARFREQPPRGEFVLVVAGAPAAAAPQATLAEGAERVRQLMARGLRRKEAVRQAAEELGLPKNALYDAALD